MLFASPGLLAAIIKLGAMLEKFSTACCTLQPASKEMIGYFACNSARFFELASIFACAFARFLELRLAYFAFFFWIARRDGDLHLRLGAGEKEESAIVRRDGDVYLGLGVGEQEP